MGGVASVFLSRRVYCGLGSDLAFFCGLGSTFFCGVVSDFLDLYTLDVVGEGLGGVVVFSSVQSKTELSFFVGVVIEPFSVINGALLASSSCALFRLSEMESLLFFNSTGSAAALAPSPVLLAEPEFFPGVVIFNTANQRNTISCNNTVESILQIIDGNSTGRLITN